MSRSYPYYVIKIGQKNYYGFSKWKVLVDAPIMYIKGSSKCLRLLNISYADRSASSFEKEWENLSKSSLFNEMLHLVKVKTENAT